MCESILREEILQAWVLAKDIINHNYRSKVFTVLGLQIEEILFFLGVAAITKIGGFNSHLGLFLTFLAV